MTADTVQATMMPLPVYSLSPLLAGHEQQHRGSEALGYELAQAQDLAPLPAHKHEALRHC